MKLIMKITLQWLRPLLEEVVTECYRWCKKGRQILLKCSSAKMIRLY